jgi:hypothetical protein
MQPAARRGSRHATAAGNATPQNSAQLCIPGMSSPLASALLAELDDDALDALAYLLGPRLHPDVEDEWLRGAERIAAYIDAPVSRVYALQGAGRIPTHKDGSALIARKSELDAWLLAGGGKRP